MTAGRAILFASIAVAEGALAHGGLGCNALRSLESCERNGDCARGTACDPSGRFCADGGRVRVGVVAPLTGTVKLRGIGDDMRARSTRTRRCP